MEESAGPHSEGQLPFLSFNRENIPGEACFARWSSLLSVVFDVEPLPCGSTADFTASMTAYHLGGLLVWRAAGSGTAFRRTGITIARGAIEHYLLQLHVEGGCRGVVGGQEVAVRAGDVCVLDLSRTLALQADDLVTIAVVVPRHSLAPLVTMPGALHGLILPAGSAVGTLLGDHLRMLYDQLPGLDGRAAAAVAKGAAGLIAACVGSALETRDHAAAEPRGALLARIEHFIEERLDSPDLDGDTICRAFGLSRSNLYRLFEPLGGVANHVRDRRLVRALGDLVAPRPDRPRVIDIAYHWGFGSEASFSRAFRAAYGLSPGEARETAGSLRRGAVPEDGSAADQILRRWMRSLACE